MVEWKPFQQTKPVVEFLIKQRDQVASTRDIADGLGAYEVAVREALKRLRKVGRVAEIHQDLWHLE